MTLDLGPWRDQAVATVTEALYARHPELEQRFGARGRQVCREDTGHHLDYLQAAIDTGESAPFLNYARWLADILEHRGVPAGTWTNPSPCWKPFSTVICPLIRPPPAPPYSAPRARGNTTCRPPTYRAGFPPCRIPPTTATPF